MKEYEKYTLSIFLGALIFNLFSINLLGIFSILLIGVALGYKYKKIQYLLLIVLVIIVGSIRTWNKELKVGDKYEINIVSDKNMEIKSINGKVLKNKVYLKNALIENNIGFFKGRVLLTKVQTFHKITYVEGKILEFNPSPLNKYRGKIRKIIENTSYSFEVESFVKAIVLGERGELPQKIEENYRKVGASHILSISGLHISIVIAAFLTLFHYFSFNYRLKYILTLIVLSGYILVLGNNPAVIRSYLMGLIYLLSKLFYEKADIKKSFCLSAIIVLSVNPTVLKDLSFLMSYSAIFGIIYVYEKFKGENLYYNAFIMSLLIQIVLSPVTVYYFKTLALYTFIFNIFIVIWGDLLINLIFIGIFLESIKLGFIIRGAVEFFYKVLDVFIKTCAKSPYSSLELEKEIAFYFFVLTVVFVITVFRYKFLSIYVLMGLIFIYSFLPYETYVDKNFIYFPKYKTLVFLSENKGEKAENYIKKSKTIISPQYIKNTIENKKNIKVKKDEKFKLDEFTFVNLGNKKLTY